MYASVKYCRVAVINSNLQCIASPTVMADIHQCNWPNYHDACRCVLSFDDVTFAIVAIIIIIIIIVVHKNKYIKHIDKRVNRTTIALRIVL